jgi:hypothetical protein
MLTYATGATRFRKVGDAGAGASIKALLRGCSAYVSIRQHTSAYVSIKALVRLGMLGIRQHTSAYVSIRQH